MHWLAGCAHSSITIIIIIIIIIISSSSSSSSSSIIIIIIILVTNFMLRIYDYRPETNHVSRYIVLQ